MVLADGSHRDIEDVQVGDEVLATDPETGETSAQPVLGTITTKGDKNLVQITVTTDASDLPWPAETEPKRAQSKLHAVKHSKNGVLIATDNHPFWVAGDISKWVEAADLKPGMWLRTSAGTYVQIAAVEHRVTHDQRVHNLTVANFHTYYVEAGDTPVLVHNCPASAGRGKPGFLKRVFGKKQPEVPAANGTVGGLRGIPHDNVDDVGNWVSDPMKRGIIRSLSDDDLLKSVFTPDDGIHMTFWDDIMMEGNHRMAELLRRADDSTSSITHDTPIYVDGW